MKATAMLKRQHRDVKTLFGAAKRAAAADDRLALLDEIAAKLGAHMMIEEQIFYPAVAGQSARKKVREMIPEAYEEHHVVKLVLAELPDVDPTDERFAAKVTVLAELVDHHVQEEEQELFPAVEKELGAEVLAELGARMQAALDSESYAEAVAAADEQGLDDEDDDDADDEDVDDAADGDTDDEDDEEVETAPRSSQARRGAHR